MLDARLGCPVKPPTQSAIAKGLGLTRARVSMLKKAGMPVSSVEAAQEWRQANVGAYARLIGAADAAGPINYAEARARREHFAARLVEMEAERVAGRLVEREKVEPAVFDAFRGLRDRIMATPRRVAPTVAPLADLREIEATIADELRSAFADFERHFAERLAARAREPGKCPFGGR